MPTTNMHNFNIKWFYTYNKFRSLACLRSCFFENLFNELRDICQGGGVYVEGTREGRPPPSLRGRVQPTSCPTRTPTPNQHQHHTPPHPTTPHHTTGGGGTFHQTTRIPQVQIRTHVCYFPSSCAGRQPFRGRYVAHTKR